MPTITYLTTIQFDFGAVKLLGGETKAVGISRPLVVTDKGVFSAIPGERLRRSDCCWWRLANGLGEGCRDSHGA